MINTNILLSNKDRYSTISDEIRIFLDANTDKFIRPLIDVRKFISNLRDKSPIGVYVSYSRAENPHAKHCILCSSEHNLANLRRKIQTKTLRNDDQQEKMDDIVYAGKAEYVEDKYRDVLESFGESIQAIEAQSEAIRNSILGDWLLSDNRQAAWEARHIYPIEADKPSIRISSDLLTHRIEPQIAYNRAFNFSRIAYISSGSSEHLSREFSKTVFVNVMHAVLICAALVRLPKTMVAAIWKGMAFLVFDLSTLGARTLNTRSLSSFHAAG